MRIDYAVQMPSQEISGARQNYNYHITWGNTGAADPTEAFTYSSPIAAGKDSMPVMADMTAAMRAMDLNTEGLEQKIAPLSSTVAGRVSADLTAPPAAALIATSTAAPPAAITALPQGKAINDDISETEGLTINTSPASPGNGFSAVSASLHGELGRVIAQIHRDAWNKSGPRVYDLPDVRFIHVVDDHVSDAPALHVNTQLVGKLVNRSADMAMMLKDIQERTGSLPCTLRVKGVYQSTEYYIQQISIQQ